MNKKTLTTLLVAPLMVGSLGFCQPYNNVELKNKEVEESVKGSEDLIEARRKAEESVKELEGRVKKLEEDAENTFGNHLVSTIDVGMREGSLLEALDIFFVPTSFYRRMIKPFQDRGYKTSPMTHCVMAGFELLRLAGYYAFIILPILEGRRRNKNGT